MNRLVSGVCMFSRRIHVIRTLSDLRSVRVSLPSSSSLGFVPTMGALHQGHIKLAQRAKEENTHTIASIFVNPTQFLPGEDFSSYPRTLSADLDRLHSVGVDFAFAPTAEEMYKQKPSVFVDIAGIDNLPEGSVRPGHFRGVLLVVSKLLNLVQPTRLYLGQKDGIQCVAITKMIEELNFPVEPVIVPTVREPDGLAMSSRNIYLSPADRAVAPILYQALTKAEEQYYQAVKTGNTKSPDVIRALVRDCLLTLVSPSSIQYISLANRRTGEEIISDPNNTNTAEWTRDGALLSIAVKFGKTRLIDNLILQPLDLSR